ncbi:(Fe-S)-binding protein [Rhodospirillum rubrum]|uniref:Fe-S cluster n=1 Tax=Rhodospirillum rubrum (strain ATCC 11170 / ATH 1.1.1 / DSM 467 / LMG 4362 / NCIMB 8255 / S1) TaxID=269796 RepID=Q2RVH5_RHORT|nr:(Fe-S)-binding protein [Rhodospirillum rubrum]ABC21870.1 Putative Fe-S cluster [Rhodospirillum rubrum ATCC 11170]AEO47572.1 putative Fe-S cluster [Rhodospirillum rubrum F11]MBK5953435.1 Fe-S cluster protein [Rhodospirillum rubrum]QXG81531.1 Fe-S cluster protein [Rhodospirillum rubrum]HAP99357.1 Fe-S cluster protein [Rhodospirillum rubrum]
MTSLQPLRAEDLPGKNCGVCGFRTCAELAERSAGHPDLIKRCLPLSAASLEAEGPAVGRRPAQPVCGGACGGAASSVDLLTARPETVWRDTLDREFDFFLEHFPEEPGPREIILPHNPLLTRELEIEVGDILIGRPLGMSCGCPITHCGVAVEVDKRTGVIVWCVTGPLGAREKGFKDLGYYIAEGYEGLITETRVPIRIGMRYYFQPRLCMLQWRHSGLVNYVNRIGDTLQVRVEGLWIG